MESENLRSDSSLRQRRTKSNPEVYNSIDTKNKSILEKKFKEQVVKWLKSVPDLYYFVKEAASIRGISDIIICYNGHFVAWELKKSQKEAEKEVGRIALQKYNIQKIQKCGGTATLVYPENFGDCKRELLSLKDFPFN